jgi:hypothetical protein
MRSARRVSPAVTRTTRYFWLVVDGKKTAIRTRFSHGAREYGDALLGAVANQMKLT